MLLRSGSILPLALIMTLTMLLAGIGIGTVVLEGVQRAKNTDQSVAAYYMSDSGIERQLYAVRKNYVTLASLAGMSSATTLKYPADGGTWKSTGNLERADPVQRFATLSTLTFAVLDLFDPDHLTAAPGVAKIRAEWSSGSDCASLGKTAGLEIDYATINQSSITGFLQTDFKIARSVGPSMTVAGLNTASPYRVRLKALDCSASSVNVTLLDSSDAPVMFFGNILLGSEGTYGKATQKIVVTMPKQDILSGLFGGYVLFSECQLLKSSSGIPACPTP